MLGKCLSLVNGVNFRPLFQKERESVHYLYGIKHRDLC